MNFEILLNPGILAYIGGLLLIFLVIGTVLTATGYLFGKFIEWLINDENR